MQETPGLVFFARACGRRDDEPRISASKQRDLLVDGFSGYADLVICRAEKRNSVCNVLARRKYIDFVPDADREASRSSTVCERPRGLLPAAANTLLKFALSLLICVGSCDGDSIRAALLDQLLSAACRLISW